MMDREQAIKAMMNGKKITRTDLDCDYLCFNDSRFRSSTGQPFNPNDIYDYEWTIYVKPITFLEAVKEMENGLNVKCKINGGTYYIRDKTIRRRGLDVNSSFTSDIINGEWEVIDA